MDGMETNTRKAGAVTVQLDTIPPAAQLFIPNAARQKFETLLKPLSPRERGRGEGQSLSQNALTLTLSRGERQSNQFGATAFIHYLGTRSENFAHTATNSAKPAATSATASFEQLNEELTANIPQQPNTDDNDSQLKDRTIGRMLGDIVWLMSQSPAHKHFSLADLEWMVMPPLALGQYRILEMASNRSAWRCGHI